MKDILNKWWFWTIVAVVGVFIYMNRNEKSINISIDKNSGTAGDQPGTTEVKV